MRSFNRGILVLSMSVILLGTTGAMLSGCTVRRVIVVKSHQKPAPRVEVKPQRPSKHYVWVPGYWKGKPGHWAWISGRWKYRRGQQSVDKKKTKVGPIVVKTHQKPATRVEVKPQRPSKHYVWVSGYWKGKPGRWTWVPGHWKNGGGQQSVDKKNTKVGSIVVESRQKPAPEHEIKPQRPSADAVWVSGHWEGKPGRWAWVPGYWRERGRK